MLLTDFAPAKVNLTLHILGRRSDGYHELESLVAFADIGDELTLDLSAPPGLSIDGPFAKDCGDVADNLVLRASNLLQKNFSELRLGAFHLIKNLPVAAGLGGGSADAAAALRLLAKANDLQFNHPAILQAAEATGADVPVCLASIPAIMRGKGELIEPVHIPCLNALLVNCGAALSTKDVFAKFSGGTVEQEIHEALPHDYDALIKWLRKHGNDLAVAAQSLCPELYQVEATLQKVNATLVRLSGSGTTIFGVYENAELAQKAARMLQVDYPDWWVKAVRLGERL